MKKLLRILASLLGLVAYTSANAQCVTGEFPITVEVLTDNWGSEAYWEITPANNTCGDGTIISNGNPDFGCGGSGTAYSGNSFYSEDYCLEPGVYTLHVIDGLCDAIQYVSVVGHATLGQCGGALNFTIVDPCASFQSSSYAQTGSIYCPGETTWVRAVGQSGTSPYEYNWSFGVTTNDEYVWDAVDGGVHTVTITDNNGCETVRSVTVEEYFSPGATPITVTETVTNATCRNSNGAIQLNVTGGNTSNEYYYYMYDPNWNWLGGDYFYTNTLNFNNLREGWYYFYIYETNNWCYEYIEVYVGDTGTPDFDVTTTNSTCGSADGTASVINLTGGAGSPYTFSWSTALVDGTPLGNTQTISGLAGGTVAVVTVTDVAGCWEINGNLVNDIGAPTVFVSTTDVVGCYDDANGAATAIVSGGTSPYTYAWINLLDPNTILGTTPTITNLTGTSGDSPEGIYVVTVTDNNSPACVATSLAFVGAPEPIHNIQIYTYQANPGLENGYAEVYEWDLQGGTSPYYFEWSTGSTDYYIEDVAGGTYTVTISDDLGCFVVETVEIYQQTCDDLYYNTYAYGDDLECNGGSDGYVYADGWGGSWWGFDYEWSNGSTDNSIYDLTAGTYTVTMTDQYYTVCQFVHTVTVSEPTPINILTFSTDETCGQENGEAIAAASGGNDGGYYYYWSNGDWGYKQENLDGGVYDVTVYDSEWCVAYASVTVTNSDEIEFDGDVTDATCGQADATGYVDVTFGGTSPYTYEWSNLTSGAVLGTEATISGLEGGIAVVISITDALGCTVWDIAIIENPGAPVIDINFVDATGCFGATNGEATAVVTSGTSPYTYEWYTLTNPTTVIGTTATLTGLLGNEVYIVQVSDAQTPSCKTIDGNYLNGPTEIEIYPYANGTSQPAGSDGYAEVYVYGGTPGYDYMWSNGGTDYYISGLSAGTYDVTITDSESCLAYATVTVTEPDCNYNFDEYQYNVECNGDDNGELEVYGYWNSGSGWGYNYEWSTGSNNSYIYDLEPGVYTVTVTDYYWSACVQVLSYTITEPEVISVTVNVTDETCGDQNGIAVANVTGGTPYPDGSYEYLWSGFGWSYDNERNNLDGGTYNVRVYDYNGCSTAQIPFTIVNSDRIEVDMDVVEPACGDADGEVNITVTGGTTPYTYNWQDLISGSSLGTTQNLSGLSGGIAAMLTITDALGCTENDGTIVNSLGAPEFL
jgi:hypothetical protein